MNPARQFLHILGKDIRGHALEIGLVLVLNLVLVLALTETWAESPFMADSGVVQSREELEEMFGIAAQILLVVAWCVLIGRIVQEDGVAGKVPYWLTRPCTRAVMLASKFAFVLLFVHLPLFLSHLAIVTGSGVPLSLAQMLVDQVVLVVCISLPIMALAALTASFTRFLFGGIAITAIASFVVIEGGSRLSLYAAIAATPSVPGQIFVLATGLAILASIAGVALVRQYRSRSTLRIAVSSTVALSVLGLGLLLAPLPFFFPFLTALARPTTVAPTIRFREAAEPRIINAGPAPNPQLVFLPIEVPDAVDTSTSTSRVELRSAAGRVVEFNSNSVAALAVRSGTGIRSSDNGDMWLMLYMPPTTYDSLKDELFSVHFVAHTVTYEVRETEPIPRDGSFVIVDGRAQCGVPARRSLTCRTSSGWAETLYDLTRAEAQQWWVPVRVRFAINPIVTVGMSNGALSQPMTREIPSSVRRRVNVTRQEVTFENIRLGDWGP
jgi:hypothetical protein